MVAAPGGSAAAPTPWRPPAPRAPAAHDAGDDARDRGEVDEAVAPEQARQLVGELARAGPKPRRG